MRLVYLIKHASPKIDPSVPASEWRLSDRGVAESAALAALAVQWDLRALYASSEAKAQSTALVIGDAIGLAVSVVDGLEEIRTRWIANSDEYSELIRDIFEHPTRSVRGVESAAAAAARFAAATEIIARGPFPAAIVSHGRVLTAWLASIGAIEDPFAFWRAMPMASWSALDLDAPNHALPFRPALP